MEKEFSTSWKSSIQPRKQRKYRFNAPNHIKQKFMGCHLSKDLRTKYGRRSIGLRKGDKVSVMRGQFHARTGKIDRVDVKKSIAYITGLDFTKKDGSKIMIKFNPSNLMITELNLDDKKRLKKVENKKKETTAKKEDKKIKEMKK